MTGPGILYVVATPIGNLGDITLRAIEVLREADLVVAEDRHRALGLLSHLGLRKPIVTINSYNEQSRARSIAAQLAAGRTAALITAAGTPCISDPGDRVVKTCLDAGIEVRAVPGASSALAALSVSGLSPDRFLFYGFLPQKKGKKRKVLLDILAGPFPVVLFESPRRVKELLEVVAEVAPERSVVVCRELTKMHEEVLRGTASEIALEVASSETRGEYTVIVDGKGRQAPP